ncbi:TPA: hypothetical protein ACFCMW_001879 [Neisseria gonorrhoeae]
MPSESLSDGICPDNLIYSGLTKTGTALPRLSSKGTIHLVLKHQVNRFRTICTVCGFVALS